MKRELIPLESVAKPGKNEPIDSSPKNPGLLTQVELTAAPLRLPGVSPIKDSGK